MSNDAIGLRIRKNRSEEEDDDDDDGRSRINGEC